MVLSLLCLRGETGGVAYSCAYYTSYGRVRVAKAIPAHRKLQIVYAIICVSLNFLEEWSDSASETCTAWSGKSQPKGMSGPRMWSAMAGRIPQLPYYPPRDARFQIACIGADEEGFWYIGVVFILHGRRE